MQFRFVVVGLLLISGALAASLLPEARSGRFESSADALLFVGATSTFLLGGVLLAWRDIHAFATLALLLGAFGGASVALAIAVGAPVGADLVVFAAASTTAVALGGGFLTFTQRRKGLFPDVLAEKFGRSSVFETGGVQLAAFFPAALPANEIAPLDVYLQNCVEGPRTVVIELDDQPLWELVWGRGGRILWRNPGAISLGPSEVKLVRIPCCAARAEYAPFPGYLSVQVHGPRAKRTRHRRAPHASRPLRTWQIVMLVLLALPLFTVVVWGRGGLRLRFRFTPAVPLRTAGELPEPSQHAV